MNGDLAEEEETPEGAELEGSDDMTRTAQTHSVPTTPVTPTKATPRITVYAFCCLKLLVDDNVVERFQSKLYELSLCHWFLLPNGVMSVSSLSLLLLLLWKTPPTLPTLQVVTPDHSA